jgi:hypothetical protein
VNWPVIIGVVAGAMVSWVVVFALHERREFRRQDEHERRAIAREERAIERHGVQMAALDKNRALTLQAVQQRSRLEASVGELSVAVGKLEERVGRLEAL